eukprot:COSAG03_NODE_232_length_10264_cov_2.708706_4_plen_658_part_00
MWAPLVLVLLVVVLLLHAPGGRSAGSLIFVTTDTDNDVVSLLRSESSGAVLRSAPDARAALKQSTAEDTILFLADNYPHTQLGAPGIDGDQAEFWRQAAAKGVKVFLEFPSELPRNATPPPSTTGNRTSGGLPCLPRPGTITPGMLVNFTYLNRDRSLCAAASCNGLQVETYFNGRHCGVRDQLIWDTFATPKPGDGLPTANCKWNRTNAPEYTGTGCGVAPVDGGVNNCGENITVSHDETVCHVSLGQTETDTEFYLRQEHLPMIFCPPVGFNRVEGGGWTGGKHQGMLTVDACATACKRVAGCSAFAVSDTAGCTIYPGQLQGFSKQANTTGYVQLPPHNASMPPPVHPIKLKNWQALRPTTGAQPAAYFGVLAPRLPEEVAAGWARVGMPKLGIFVHHAAQSTLPESWPLYAPRYCHSVTDTASTLDCSIENGTVVHAYSTIASGFDTATFGIDTLQPAVVPHPSPPGIGNVPLLYSFNTSHGVPVFVSATKISDLIKHRYAPRDHWRAVWDFILQEFAQTSHSLPNYIPAVGPSFGPNASLPPTFRSDAVRKATDWFFAERGPTACVPSPCMSSNQTTSTGMSMFYRGVEMCGTEPDFPADVKAGAMCVIEGVNGKHSRHVFMCVGQDAQRVLLNSAVLCSAWQGWCSRTGLR